MEIYFNAWNLQHNAWVAKYFTSHIILNKSGSYLAMSHGHTAET